MEQKKNLVMGAVKGYSFDQLKPFVLSLKQTGYNGDIVLLHDSLSVETSNSLMSHGVKLVPLQYRGNGSANSWSRFWPRIKPMIKVLRGSGPGRYVMKMITPLQTSRFYNYRDYLLKNASRYEHVLITDVRDVFFQADPFLRFHKKNTQCYEEDLHLKDDPRFNLPWIEALFGKASALSFLDQKIICSGTILGPVPAMLRYLQAFESTLRDANDISMGGSDQGLHNYLIRTGYRDADIVSNGKGEVLTISKQNIVNYKTDGQGRFCDDSGNLIPVIHQYDRDAELAERMLRSLNNQSQ